MRLKVIYSELIVSVVENTLSSKSVFECVNAMFEKKQSSTKGLVINGSGDKVNKQPDSNPEKVIKSTVIKNAPVILTSSASNKKSPKKEESKSLENETVNAPQNVQVIERVPFFKDIKCEELPNLIVNSIPLWTHYVDEVIEKCHKESDVHFDCGGKRYSIALELSPLLYVTFKDP